MCAVRFKWRMVFFVFGAIMFNLAQCKNALKHVKMSFEEFKANKGVIFSHGEIGFVIEQILNYSEDQILQLNVRSINSFFLSYETRTYSERFLRAVFAESKYSKDHVSNIVKSQIFYEEFITELFETPEMEIFRELLCENQPISIMLIAELIDQNKLSRKSIHACMRNKKIDQGLLKQILVF
jgi:hypothetical protein